MGVCMKKNKFYGGFFKFCRATANFFVPKGKFKNKPKEYDEPVVYVCRHLNMHGPLTIARSFKKDLHIFVLHNFFTKEEAYPQFLNNSFKNKKNKKFLANFAGTFVPKIVNSGKFIPVYRGDDKRSFLTIKKAYENLNKGQSLAVFPDKTYKAKYGEPSDIYPGFLVLEKIYYKKYNKHLKFVPLVLDDKNRTIIEKDPITFVDDIPFNDQLETIKQEIIKAIDKTN